MKKQQNNKSSTGKKAVLIGAGIVVAAAAAYFLSDKKNRKAVKTWAIKMKADVIEKLEAAGDLTKETYEQTIDAISEKYKKLGNMDHNELSMVAADLKKKWNMIKRDMKRSPSVKKVKSVAKKVAKEAVKKVSKKK